MIDITKLTKPTLKIGTHDGDHHADDVLAVSLLKYLYDPTHDVIILRTRDEAILNTCDMLVDVGKKYDGVKYFDHHQDLKLKCSASLVWKAVAAEKFPFEYDYVNKFVLDAVSGLDVDIYSCELERGSKDSYYNITTLISDLNYLETNQFESALEIGLLFWKAILLKARKLVAEVDCIKVGILEHHVLWLQKGMDIKNHLELLKRLGVRYVVHPHYNPNKFCLKTISSHEYPLPDFEKVEFLHAARFLAIFSNLKDVESAVKTIINNYETFTI